VTGAGRGAGAAIAARLAEEGARVLATSRTEATLREVVTAIRSRGGTAEALVEDLILPGAAERVVAAAVDRLGGIDVLVNNAATFVLKPFLDVGDDEWDRTIATNLSAPFRLTRAAARQMAVQGGGGSIIHIASIHARIAEADLAPHVAAKAGLVGLTGAAADALRVLGIRVNAVSPGAIESCSAGRPGASPLEKVTQGDVANLVAYLASDLARTITGAVIDISGATRTILTG